MFHLPFDHLAHDPFDVMTWHLYYCSLSAVIIFPPYGGLIGHKETMVRFR